MWRVSVKFKLQHVERMFLKLKVTLSTFHIIKPTRCTNFSIVFFEMKLYMFWTVPLSIIRSFSLYTPQWYMSYRFAYSLWAGAYAPAHKLTANLYDIYHWGVYSEKLLMMDRGTVRNMQSFISKNTIEKLVHLVGFIIWTLSRCTVMWTSNCPTCLNVICYVLTFRRLTSTIVDVPHR